MKIDDRKVEAIKQMSAPKDKKGLQSFRDMVSYLKRYSVQLMKLSEPLKPLLREDVEWSWDYSDGCLVERIGCSVATRR